MTFQITLRTHPKHLNGLGEKAEIYYLCVIDEKDKVELWLTREKELSRNYRDAGFLSSYANCWKAMREIEEGYIREGLAYSKNNLKLKKI